MRAPDLCGCALPSPPWSASGRQPPFSVRPVPGRQPPSPAHPAPGRLPPSPALPALGRLPTSLAPRAAGHLPLRVRPAAAASTVRATLPPSAFPSVHAPVMCYRRPPSPACAPPSCATEPSSASIRGWPPLPASEDPHGRLTVPCIGGSRRRSTVSLKGVHPRLLYSSLPLARPAAPSVEGIWWTSGTHRSQPRLSWGVHRALATLPRPAPLIADAP